MDLKRTRLFASLTLGLAGGLLALGIASASPALGAGSRYVSTSGQDVLPGDVDNTCASPSEPCLTIQHAVDMADAGDEVKVATGTYADVQVRHDMTQTAFISKSLTVRGGYSGDFATWDADPSATVLDGGADARQFWISRTVDGPVTIEALQLLDGSTPEGGGAIYAVESQLMVSSCQVISANAADKGGAIFLQDSDGSVIANSLFDGTSGIINGCGAICVVDSEDVSLDHLDIAGSQGSGVWVHHSDRVTVSHSAVHNTQIAFQMSGIGITRTTGVRVLYNKVYSNTALDASGIAIIECDGAVVWGNQVGENTSRVGSGILIQDSNEAMLANNVVYKNSLLGAGDDFAPGILLYAADGKGSGPPYYATLLHNTVAENTGSDGEGIHISLEGRSSVTLTNNIIVSQSIGIYVKKGSTATLEATLWGAGDWANDTDWDGPGNIYTGTINVWAGPEFVDPASGDYHITAGSGAIDTGVEAGVADDIDGDARPQGDYPDIGADEYLLFLRISLPLVIRSYG